MTRKHKKWTQEELSYVRSNYNRMSAKSIARHLKRTVNAVRYQASRTLKVAPKRTKPIVANRTDHCYAFHRKPDAFHTRETMNQMIKENPRLLDNYVPMKVVDVSIEVQ